MSKLMIALPLAYRQLTAAPDATLEVADDFASAYTGWAAFRVSIAAGVADQEQVVDVTAAPALTAEFCRLVGAQPLALAPDAKIVGMVSSVSFQFDMKDTAGTGPMDPYTVAELAASCRLCSTAGGSDQRVSAPHAIGGSFNPTTANVGTVRSGSEIPGIPLRAPVAVNFQSALEWKFRFPDVNPSGTGVLWLYGTFAASDSGGMIKTGACPPTEAEAQATRSNLGTLKLLK